MSLRVKTLIIIGSTLIGLVIALYGLFRGIVLSSFEQLEAQNMQRNVERVLNAVANELDLLSGVNADWAYWTSTYEFMASGDEEYIAENITDRTFTDLAIESMIFVNTEGQIVYDRNEDPTTREITSLPGGLESYLMGDDPFLTQTDEENSVQGILLTGQGATMVVSRAILTSEAEGPSQGSLIFGRVLTDERIQALGESLNLTLTAHIVGEEEMPPDFATAYQSLASQGPIFTQPISGQTVAGYGVINDIGDTPTLILRAELPRTIYQQGERTLLYFLIGLLIAGLVFGGATLLLLQRFVLSRLAYLNDRLGDITARADFNTRIGMPGDDELAELGGAIDSMLSTLSQSQNKITQARDHALEVLRLKDQILSNISYDARNPLSVILLRTEMIQKGIYGAVTEAQSAMLETITVSGRQLLNFVNNLLDAGQLNAGTLQLNKADFNPRELLDRVEATMLPVARNKDLEFSAELADNLPPLIYGDSDRLEQILLNLMDNAIKFTEKGSVSAYIYRPDENHWALQVADTGIGIPEDSKSTIFESFWQVDASVEGRTDLGVGLGLSIVARLVRLMDGRVTIESIVNSGSIFTVILPLEFREEGIVDGQAARYRR